MAEHDLMSQVVFPRAGRCRIETAAIPSPRGGEVLIAPDRVGLCATDLELFDGSMVYLRQGLTQYPIRPGHEWTGRVLEVGAGVVGISVGDRVVGECSIGCAACRACLAGAYHRCPTRHETGIFGQPGALATHLLFPARSAFVVPPSVDADEAVFVEPLAVALRAFEVAEFEDGMSVAVVGAGTIGMLVMVLARALGASSVTFREPDPDRSNRARDFGFSPETRQSVVDLVVECAGKAGAVRDAVELSRPGGFVAVLGLSGRPSVPLPVDDIVVSDLTLRGSLGSPGVWPRVLSLLAGQELGLSRLISHQVGLSEACSAVALLSGVERVGKVVVEPQQA